jgi:hypothetical protein
MVRRARGYDGSSPSPSSVFVQGAVAALWRCAVRCLFWPLGDGKSGFSIPPERRQAWNAAQSKRGPFDTASLSGVATRPLYPSRPRGLSRPPCSTTPRCHGAGLLFLRGRAMKNPAGLGRGFFVCEGMSRIPNLAFTPYPAPCPASSAPLRGHSVGNALERGRSQFPSVRRWWQVVQAFPHVLG